MPLTEKSKTQSQSIEDLIAQLDTPAPSAPLSANASNSDADESSGTNGARKFLKGKRQNSSNGSVGSPSATATAATSSFVKTNSFGQNSEPVLHKNILMSKKYTKHMKSLKERGSMKKNGAGGRHNWGTPGCELEDDYLDTKDPNYDSEGENVVMVCVENSETKSKSGTKSAESDPEPIRDENLKDLDVESLETEIKLVVLEYFHNGDTIEVTDQFKCYNFAKVKPQLIAYLIQLALENNNTCKELTSRLLRDLNVELFAEKDFVHGFDLVLKNLPDLTLDNPDAPEKSGTFIARAVADKVITTSYLDRFFDNNQNNLNLPDISDERILKAIESARLLLNMSNNLFQLSRIWGNNGGFLAVKELTDKINELIQEYHDSGDVEEAIRCLRDLNVPHFNHEFIYEALDFALQKGDDHAIELVTNLLNRLCQSVIITYDQLKMGFTRIFDLLPDISLDVPNASALMDKILNMCHSKGFVSEDIMDLAPNRSRKRFVSEGDGGRIKEEIGH